MSVLTQVKKHSAYMQSVVDDIAWAVLVVPPKMEGSNKLDLHSYAEWMEQNRSACLKELARHRRAEPCPPSVCAARTLNRQSVSESQEVNRGSLLPLRQASCLKEQPV